MNKTLYFTPSVSMYVKLFPFWGYSKMFDMLPPILLLYTSFVNLNSFNYSNLKL